MAQDDWEFYDAYATFLDRDAARRDSEPVLPEQTRPHYSGGAHPPPGQYVIDPDYAEVMGIDDPLQLYRYFK